MGRVLFFLLFIVIAFIAYREIKRYTEFTKQQDALEKEKLRESSLDVEAEAVIRRAKNDAFEKEIDGLEDEEK